MSKPLKLDLIFDDLAKRLNQDMSAREIAQKHGISMATVRKYTLLLREYGHQIPPARGFEVKRALERTRSPLAATVAS